MPCAMCHQSTHGRHHRRSGVLARRMVPRRARSDQLFGRYSRKCLDTHTDRQTRPANYFSPTHQWKSSFIERSMLKHLNVHSLRFWITLNMHQIASHPRNISGIVRAICYSCKTSINSEIELLTIIHDLLTCGPKTRIRQHWNVV